MTIQVKHIIEGETKKICDSKLLIAATEGEISAVKDLIKKGGNVNYKGVNGNTPLHGALLSDASKTEIIIETLLENGADLNIENDEFETPFDIAGRLATEQKDNIIRHLQKHVIKDSFAILDNHVKSHEFFNTFEKSKTSLMKSKIYSCLSIDVETNNYTSDSSREFSKKVDKIKTCLDYLVNLNNEGMNKATSTNFTYKQANIFIFFLEAVSFQDIELSADTKREIRFVFEMNKSEFGSDIEKKIGKEIEAKKLQLLKLVKDCFTYNFYPPKFEEDLKLIDVARRILCHSSNKKITLEDVAKLVIPGANTKMFFKNIEEYVTYIYNKMENLNELCEVVELKSVLKNITRDDNMNIGIQGDDILEKELIDLIVAIYNQENWSQEKTQKTLFSFLVNISPAFGKEMKGLSKLRNKIIHEFHSYKDVDDIIKMEFKKAVYDLRSKLFKYYYAKQVHVILQGIKPSDDSTDIDKKLRTALTEIQDRYGQDFKIVSQEEADGCFEYQGSVSSKISTTSDKEDILKNVIQYLKFVAIMDDEKTEEPFEIHQYSDDILYEEKWETLTISDDEETEDENEFQNGVEILNIEEFPQSRNCQVLNVINKKYIFDKFVKLKQLKISVTSLQYEKERTELEVELRTKYGIKKYNFDLVFRLFIEGNADLPQENQSQLDRLVNTIHTLRKLKMDYKVLHRDLLHLYSKIVKGKGYLDIEETVTLINCTPVRGHNKEHLFQKELASLYKHEFMQITIFEGLKLNVNVVTLVTDILGMFYDSFNSYQIKFNNIEEAFNDETFLDNLVEQEKLKQKAERNQNFENYAFMIFKKLLKIEYTVPYIVRSIVENNNSSAMESEDMKKLTLVLLVKVDYVDYLNDLLKVGHAGVDLYELVINSISENNIEGMRPIFKEPQHLKIIWPHFNFNRLGLNDTESKKSIKLQKDIMILLNDIVHNLFCEGSFDEALHLLSLYLDECSSTIKEERLQAKRLEARIRNQKGQLIKRKYKSHINSKALEGHKLALTILEEVKTEIEEAALQHINVENASLYLLTLSNIADTHHLLGDRSNAVKWYGKLYLEIKWYTLGVSAGTPEQFNLQNCRMMINIIQLKSYNELLSFSDETREFLDILKIQKNLAWRKIIQARRYCKKKRGIKLLKTSINILREVYRIQKQIEKKSTFLMAETLKCIAEASDALGQFTLLCNPRNDLKLFQHCVEALMSYNAAYYIAKEAPQEYSDISKRVACIYRELNAFFEYELSNLKYFNELFVKENLDSLREYFPQNMWKPVKCPAKTGRKKRKTSRHKKSPKKLE